ncbi:MAG: hypothetical protein UR15_C0008G0008 [Parcubacteria group bacterium GW2011_GWA2_31_28]|nr:MAG: hypothetical protein UR15_C0008G0008 [Parcubacteria group bacterium GW2011_GWA2_31_28]
MKKKYYLILLSGLVIFAVFLRLFKLQELNVFSAETARHYLEINKISQGQLLINGPLTSHSWFRLSPIFYYLTYPLFLLTGFHPLTGLYISAFVHILLIFLNYGVVKKIFGRKTAIISSFFIGSSSFLLIQERDPGFFGFIIPLTYALLWFSYRMIKNRNSGIWPVFFIISLMTALHLSAIVLILFFVIYILFLHRWNIKNFISSCIAFIIPQIPFLINDYSRGFQMTKTLLLWIPYKALNFLTGKTLGVDKITVKDDTFIYVSDFFRASFFPPKYPAFLGIIILFILILYFIVKKRGKFERFLFYWLSFVILALIIHKNPPLHYFVIVFILPIILLSQMLSKLSKDVVGKIILTTGIVSMVLPNILFIFSNDFFFSKEKTRLPFIPYSSQMEIAKTIIKDSAGKNFTINRIGPFDQYENEYKENYEYILWWLGNKPSAKADLHYLIVEEKHRIPKTIPNIIIGEINGITVFKTASGK